MKSFTQSFKRFLIDKLYPTPVRIPISIICGIGVAHFGLALSRGHWIIGGLGIAFLASLFTLSLYSIELYWREWREKISKRGYVTRDDLR